MSEGKGAANDAGVVTEDGQPNEADEAAAKAAAIAEADRIVTASEAKVAIQEEHLAGAKAALELAVSDRKGLD